MNGTKPLTGKHVFFMVFIFFATVSAVDGLFVYKALQSNTGVVTDQAYEKGLAFDKILQEAEQQEALNVTAKTAYSNGLLSLQLKDKSGVDVKGARITAKIIRPVAEGHDFEIAFLEKKPGVYESEVKMPLPGLWEAKMEAKWDTKIYRKIMRFMAP
jgi:nitrogen fixation protein FixH